MIELDLEIDLEAFERLKHRPLVTVGNLQRLGDADEALRRELLLDAGRLQQEHEVTRAAVHDGYFRRAHLDDGVVDPEACERRQQVLDGGDPRLTPDQGRSQLCIADVFRVGDDGRELAQVGAPKQDSGIRRRRAQCHQDLLAGVQSDARGADGVLQCTLSDHLILDMPGPPSAPVGPVVTRARRLIRRAHPAPGVSGTSTVSQRRILL